MNEEKEIENGFRNFIEKLKESKSLSNKVVENLEKNKLGTDLDIIYWKNIYKLPIEEVIKCESIMKNKTCCDILIEYIINGIEFYVKLIDKIREEKNVECLFKDIGSNRNYLEILSRCYLYRGYLELYMLYISCNENIFISIKNSFFISFIIDPSHDFALMGLSKLFFISHDNISCLFYTFKGVYGVLYPNECKDKLDEMIKLYNNEITNNAEDLYDSKNLIYLLITSFLNKSNEKEFDYEKLEKSITLLVKECMESNKRNNEIIMMENEIKYEISTKTLLRHVLVVMIIIMDNLRKNDSDTFRKLLKCFSTILKYILSEIGKIVKTHEEVVCYSEDEHSEDDEVKLEGLRINYINNENDINIYSKNILEIIKLIIDWFYSWPEVIDIINDISDMNIIEYMKSIFNNIVVNHDEFNKDEIQFFHEDFDLIGYPLFINLHKKPKLNLLHIIDDISTDNNPIRLQYIINMLNCTEFNNNNEDNYIVTNPSSRPWFKNFKKSKFSRRAQDKNVSKQLQTASSDHDYNTRIVLICFSSVLYDEKFIKKLLYKKIFRIIVPEASLNKIDDQKKNSEQARSVLKFILNNCYPKYIGFRLQKRDEASSLPQSPKPDYITKIREFRYVDSVIQTAIYHCEHCRADEIVLLLIGDEELKELFGHETNFLDNTAQQVHQRSGLLQHSINKGVRITSKSLFLSKYIDNNQ